MLGRLLRRYGWLFGVYLAVGGAGILGIGALAGYMTRRMFTGFGGDFDFFPEMAEMAANNPVSIMAKVFMVLGAVLLVVGIVLAVILKRKGKK